MSLRKLVFWLHLTAGVTCGLVIFTMSATGAALAFEKQLIAWADRGYRSVPPEDGAPRLPPSALLARVQAAAPDAAPTALTLASRQDAPASVGTAQGTVLVDAYTGRILGPSAPGMRRAMAELRAVHRWLAVEGEGRAAARAVTGWATLVFFFILCSGVYLWFPRVWTWARVRPVVWFRGGLRGKARDFNWHNTLGAWSAIPLLVVVFAALPMSFPWFNAALYRAVGDRLPAPQEPAARGRPAGEVREGGARGEERVGAGTEGRTTPSTLDAAWSAAEARVAGWSTVTLRFPATVRGDAPLVFTIDRGNGGQPQLRSTLTLDARTGVERAYVTMGDQSPGRRLRSFLRFAHTGEVWGIPGQVVMGLASLGAAMLALTGVSLALRRLRGWIGRRTRGRTAAAGRLDPTPAATEPVGR